MKKDKEIVLELESQIRDINQQFLEQIRSLDQRVDIHQCLVWEMQDYYKRKIEGEYAKNLEKLSKQINLRHKDNKQKRECWNGYTTCTAWQGLIASTKQNGKDNASLCEIVNNLIVNRLFEVSEDIQRIYKKCMKTYHLYHGESQVAENKLLRVQSQKVKVDQQNLLAKKFVNYEKKSEKKQAKYTENKLKAMKARNEYLILLEVANALVKKYFTEDFPCLVTKLDTGYHQMINRVLETHSIAERILAERDLERAKELFSRAKMIDGLGDFENVKSLEMAEEKFLEKLRGVQSTNTNNTIEQYFLDDKSTSNRSPTTEKSKEDKIKLEDYVIELYRDCLSKDCLIVRLKTKMDLLKNADGVPPNVPPKPKKKFAKSTKGSGKRPAMFGGVIEEYVEATGEAIPAVMKSCISYINLHGEDPLQYKTDGDEVNAVAGLLKMYLRDLKEPLFTFGQYDNLIRCSEAVYSDSVGWMETMKEILKSLSAQRITIMRYLFEFLSHVTEHSDENMMEAYNLSICFGPTLIYAPADRVDQHQYQGHINNLVKNIILHHEEIFPPPTEEDYQNEAVYEKYISDKDYLDSISDDDGLKDTLNEEDEEFDKREAKVEEDYVGQSSRELTVSKGDVVQLLSKESSDWWLVEIGGSVGVLPDRVLSYGRGTLNKLKRSNLNKSTECLISSAYSQSNSSLNKCPSQSNLLAPASESTGQSGNRSFKANKQAIQSSNDVLSTGLDNVMAKPPGVSAPPSSRNSFGSTQKPVVFKKRNTSSSSELDVIVSPPSPRSSGTFPTPPPIFSDNNPILGKTGSPVILKKPNIISAAAAANALASASIVSGRSGSERISGSSGGGSTAKWNSLPHNIPTSESSTSVSPQRQQPQAINATLPAAGSRSKSPLGSTISLNANSFLQQSQQQSQQHFTASATAAVGQPDTSPSASATLPRLADRQANTATPPAIRAKPVFKKRISVENSLSTTTITTTTTPPTVTNVETTPQQQQQQKQATSTATTVVTVATTSTVATASTSKTSQISKPPIADNLVAGSTFLAHLDVNASHRNQQQQQPSKSNERDGFSSFKISSNIKKS
ncbi:hypothetical protein HELRODRAFT_191557 [Helobdella robusta]|uniref:SH3 domain-containing protein n=1 Tax=Helobdella robusta TaxID=6412 RepID=T1FT29_HELRO|nr:hypothetical protein HELRODRAFT_191557 [Helobdella robusta]ESO05026.1 hypothetical protein HELRODRAFT_191557 [Helobdella robusta]